MVPHEFESCDWWTEHRGPIPSYWQYVKHAACHWLVNHNLELAKAVVPDSEWRILTSELHSTVYNGHGVLFDFNFCALGISPEEAYRMARDGGNGKILKPGEHLTVHYAEHCGIINKPIEATHFRQQDDRLFHVDSGHCVGRVIPLKDGKGFSVHRTMTIRSSERDKIGVVKSMDEALPMLTDYYEKRWPQWKRIRNARHHEDGRYSMHTEFIKWSPYGVFTVKRQDYGLWVATRCCDALLHNGGKIFFSTAESAKHAVDLHEWDGFGSYSAIDDGFSWDGCPWIVPGAYQTNGLQGFTLLAS
jgi:hypothetical protein